MIDLTPFKTDLEKICKEFALQQLALIGSAARDDFSPESDIDVLVTFQGDYKLFDRYFCTFQNRAKVVDSLPG